MTIWGLFARPSILKFKANLSILSIKSIQLSVTRYTQPEPFGPELTAEGRMSKACVKSNPVWVTEAWNLDIICYL
jgi:hypothetical protein